MWHFKTSWHKMKSDVWSPVCEGAITCPFLGLRVPREEKRVPTGSGPGLVFQNGVLIMTSSGGCGGL